MKKFKYFIIYIILQFLYRGLKVLYKDDSRIMYELDGWKSDKIIRLRIIDGPSITFQYTYLKGIKKLNSHDIDIDIIFKNIHTAFLVFIGLKSVKQAYLDHDFILKGDIFESMRFVRCVDLVEIYLFPRFMTKHIFNHYEKRYEPMILVYLKAILGG